MQVLRVPKYAVSVASRCPGPLYRFYANMTCQADRTFAPPLYYDDCEPPPPVLQRDGNGCAVLPGYSFMPWMIPGVCVWTMQLHARDGT